MKRFDSVFNHIKLDTAQNKCLLKKSALIVSLACFSGCSYLPETRVYDNVNVPSNWQSSKRLPANSPTMDNSAEQVGKHDKNIKNNKPTTTEYDLTLYQNLLSSVANDELMSLIHYMFSNNHSLQALSYTNEQNNNTFDNNDANLFPSLSSAFKLTRAREDGDPASYSTTAKLSFSSSYTLDVWGKLSEQRKQGFYSYQKGKISFEQKKLSAITGLIKLYFSLVHSTLSLEIIQEQTDNLSQRLVSIERKYQQGLTSLLDVYLARNSLHAANANLLKQQGKTKGLTRQLSIMLGSYPAPYAITSSHSLVIPTPTLPKRMPSDVMMYRADIQSAWLNVLMKESALAIAHKNRFPSISLSAGIDRSDSELGELLSNGIFNWNLAANIATPIFDAGRLATKESNALLELTKVEHNYATTTYKAFAQVESTLAKISTLTKAMQLDRLSLNNVLKAEELANAQYQTGLIDFIKVLDAQKRAMSAKLTEANNKLALLNSAIDLYLALGGDINFSKSLPEIAPKTQNTNTNTNELNPTPEKE